MVALLRGIPGLRTLSETELVAFGDGLEVVEVAPGQQVEFAVGVEVVLVLDGVAESFLLPTLWPLFSPERIEELTGVRPSEPDTDPRRWVVEGPSWVGIRERLPALPPSLVTLAAVRFVGPGRYAKLGLAGHFAGVDLVDLASGELKATRREAKRLGEGLEDFLDPLDASIPAADYEAEDVDLVMLVVSGGVEVSEAEARGHDVFGTRSLVVFTHYPRFGAFQLSTSYDEVAFFAPLKRWPPTVYTHSLYPNSSAAVVVGRETFGFPKDLGRTRLGRTAAWVNHPVRLLADWDSEVAVELDVFGAEVLSALQDLGRLGRVLASVADVVPGSTLTELLVDEVPLVTKLPDGREARFELGLPRAIRRLEGLQCFSTPERRIHGGWRLRLDMRLLDVGSRSWPARTMPVSDAPEIAPVDSDGMPLLTLKPGYRGRVPPDRVGEVITGRVSKILVEDGRRRFAGSRGPGGLLGLSRDPRVEVLLYAEEHSEIALVEAKKLGEDSRYGELLCGEIRRHQLDLSRLQSAALDEPIADTNYAVFELDGAGPWALPPGFRAVDRSPLLVARSTLVDNIHILISQRTLTPEEQLLKPYEFAAVDLVALWLPHEEGWYMPIGWATSTGALLAERAKGRPVRLGRSGDKAFHLIVDGFSAFRPVLSDHDEGPYWGVLPREFELFVGQRTRRGGELRIRQETWKRRDPFFSTSQLRAALTGGTTLSGRVVTMMICG